MSITAEDYRATSQTEHRLQVLVLQHIKLRGSPGLLPMAMTNEGKRTPRLGARFKEAGLTPGAPDLVVALPGGKVVWLELKNGRAGRQSVVQKGMQYALTQIGHTYILARTLDEAIDGLEKAGALR